MPSDDFTDHDRDGAAESSEDDSWGSSGWDENEDDTAAGDDAGSWGVADEEGAAP